MALPLIPLDEIECAFGKIVNEAPRSMKPLIQYFNGYWMTKVKWTLWNVSDVDIRSNNMVEGEFVPFSCLFYFYQIGWNHRFNRLVAKYHPNVWHLFECLKKEEVAIRQQMLKMMMGATKIRNKKTIAVQQRINSLGSQFKQNKITLGVLLEGLSLLVGAKQ
jgi:hypothetical protein